LGRNRGGSVSAGVPCSRRHTSGVRERIAFFAGMIDVGR
jgi:hypothetical protein